MSAPLPAAPGGSVSTEFSSEDGRLPSDAPDASERVAHLAHGRLSSSLRSTEQSKPLDLPCLLVDAAAFVAVEPVNLVQ